MAVAVVDALEVVHVDHQHRKLVFLPPGQAQFAPHDGGQEAAVVELRQHIAADFHVAQPVEHGIDQKPRFLQVGQEVAQRRAAIALRQAVGLMLVTADDEGQQRAVEVLDLFANARQFGRLVEQQRGLVLHPQPECRRAQRGDRAHVQAGGQAAQHAVFPFGQRAQLFVALQRGVLPGGDHAEGFVGARTLFVRAHVRAAHFGKRQVHQAANVLHGQHQVVAAQV